MPSVQVRSPVGVQLFPFGMDSSPEQLLALDAGRKFSNQKFSGLLITSHVWKLPLPRSKDLDEALGVEDRFVGSLRMCRTPRRERRGLAFCCSPCSWLELAEAHLPGVNLDLLPLGQQLPNVSLTFQAWRQDRGIRATVLPLHDTSPLSSPIGRAGDPGSWTSSERIQLWAMRLDLRDLQRHLRFQVENPPTLLDPQRPKLVLRIRSASQLDHILTMGLSSQTSARMSWPQLLYAYRLLHSLELVLSRAVRDLLLLSQAKNPGQALGCPTLAGSQP
ncbi:hypothetical protein QTO34_013286 [Cnephaeus nilssonii]|uniref:Uncharacterized protein n=1 Tax=Cnephaeus nilssonii TaxID=3371016 RepID=A0AA40I7R4_CNENI|nr:hypothetical protein QTO34_013286 [Eptesicus nilssonii]